MVLRQILTRIYPNVPWIGEDIDKNVSEEPKLVNTVPALAIIEDDEAISVDFWLGSHTLLPNG